MTAETAKTAYLVGQEFDLSSVSVKVGYSDGSSDTFTGAQVSYTVKNAVAGTSVSSGKVAEGENVLTFTYGVNKATASVTVYGYKAAKVELANLPTTATAGEETDADKAVSVSAVKVYGETVTDKTDTSSWKVTVSENDANDVVIAEDKATKLEVVVKNTSRTSGTNYYGDSFTYSVYLSDRTDTATDALSSDKYGFIGTAPTATTFGKDAVTFTVYLKSNPAVQGTGSIAAGTDYVTDIKVTSNDSVEDQAGNTISLSNLTFEVTYAISNSTTTSGTEWTPSSSNAVITNPDVPAKTTSAQTYTPSVQVLFERDGGTWVTRTSTSVTIPAVEGNS